MSRSAENEALLRYYMNRTYNLNRSYNWNSPNLGTTYVVPTANTASSRLYGEPLTMPFPVQIMQMPLGVSMPPLQPVNQIPEETVRQPSSKPTRPVSLPAQRSKQPITPARPQHQRLIKLRPERPRRRIKEVPATAMPVEISTSRQTTGGISTSYQKPVTISAHLVQPVVDSTVQQPIILTSFHDPSENVIQKAVEESISKTKSTNVDNISQVISLSRELSAAQLDRTMSQIELNELRNKAKHCTNLNTIILGIMLSYLKNTDEVRNRIELIKDSYSQGVHELQRLKEMTKNLEEEAGNIYNEDPIATLRKLQKRNHKLSKLHPYLLERVKTLRDMEQKYIDVLKLAGSSEFKDKLMLRKQQSELFRRSKRDIPKQLAELQMRNSKLKLMIKEEELNKNECSVLITEGNIVNNHLKQKVDALTFAIDHLKNELSQREFADPTNDIVDLLKHYFFSESCRKSLSYQKRWLLMLLNNWQKRKGQDNQNDQRILFKYTNNGLNCEGLWRAAGFAVVAIFRLRYLVKVRTRLHRYEVNTLRQALASSKQHFCNSVYSFKNHL